MQQIRLAAQNEEEKQKAEATYRNAAIRYYLVKIGYLFLVEKRWGVFYEEISLSPKHVVSLSA